MKKKKIYLLIAGIVSTAVLIVTVSYAWFYQHAALATLMNIVPPDSIKIIPMNDQGGDVTMLDLDYNEIYGDKRDETTKRVTIYRPLYVTSTSPVHQLEIVHTTNLLGLQFHIYSPKDKNNIDFKEIDKAIGICNEITGNYQNSDTNNASLANPDKLHNYKDGDNVEEHVYPLYWLAGNTGDKDYVATADLGKVNTEVDSTVETKYDPAKQTDRNYYKTQYYLVISWIETGKETDLFYILAQNVAVTEKSEGSVGNS